MDYCGIELVRHLYLDGVDPTMSPSDGGADDLEMDDADVVAVIQALTLTDFEKSMASGSGQTCFKCRNAAN